MENLEKKQDNIADLWLTDGQAQNVSLENALNVTTPDDPPKKSKEQKIDEADKKVILTSELLELRDDDPSNDRIMWYLLNDDGTLNDTLISGLKEDEEDLYHFINLVNMGLKYKTGDVKEDLLKLKKGLLDIKQSIIDKKYEWIKDIHEQEFFDLCQKDSLTDKEIKQVVSYSIKHKDGELSLQVKDITNEQAKYLWDVKSLQLYWINTVTLSQAEYLNRASYIFLYLKELITKEVYKKLEELWAIVDVNML